MISHIVSAIRITAFSFAFLHGHLCFAQVSPPPARPKNDQECNQYFDNFKETIYKQKSEEYDNLLDGECNPLDSMSQYIDLNCNDRLRQLLDERMVLHDEALRNRSICYERVKSAKKLQEDSRQQGVLESIRHLQETKRVLNTANDFVENPTTIAKRWENITQGKTQNLIRNQRNNHQDPLINSLTQTSTETINTFPGSKLVKHFQREAFGELKRQMNYTSDDINALVKEIHSFQAGIAGNAGSQHKFPHHRIPDPALNNNVRAVKCAILQDPARSEMLMAQDEIAWLKLVESCE